MRGREGDGQEREREEGEGGRERGRERERRIVEIVPPKTHVVLAFLIFECVAHSSPYSLSQMVSTCATTGVGPLPRVTPAPRSTLAVWQSSMVLKSSSLLSIMPWSLLPCPPSPCSCLHPSIKWLSPLPSSAVIFWSCSPQVRWLCFPMMSPRLRKEGMRRKAS